ncbi:MAG: molybdate ABC transporter permease subunit [Hyphomicrobiaceae bacterium]|nr:molybdate ABC transporter permease subunit [Hyphomicrobiaceae bacterium]
MLTLEEMEALRLSLGVAFVATLVSIPLAIATAFALSRGRFAGRALLDSAVHLPLVLPPVVTGYLLLMTFGRRGPVGQLLESHFGIVLSFRWTGAVLAAAIMGFPLLVRSVRLSLEAVDRRYEQAAGSLGANPTWVFLTVTLPLTLPGVLAGAILAFAKALGEFGATITFVSAIPGETKTIPAAIYGYVQTPGADGNAMRLAALSALVSIAALAASETMTRRYAQQEN